MNVCFKKNYHTIPRFQQHINIAHCLVLHSSHQETAETRSEPGIDGDNINREWKLLMDKKSA